MKFNSETKWRIGILAFGMLAIAYYFYNPQTIDSTNLISVNGQLFSEPYHYTHNDNPSYIRIQLKGHYKKYYINGCSYRSIDENTILNLNIGDNIQLSVFESELTKKSEKSVEVYGINISGKDILNSETYNRCERVAWKRIAVVLGLYILILVISTPWKSLISRMFKK